MGDLFDSTLAFPFLPFHFVLFLFLSLSIFFFLVVGEREGEGGGGVVGYIVSLSWVLFIHFQEKT